MELPLLVRPDYVTETEYPMNTGHAFSLLFAPREIFLSYKPNNANRLFKHLFFAFREDF